jgi:hypothetical protein
VPVLPRQAIMTPSARLLARLRAQGVQVPEGAQIRRTYAGRCQREAGAWSWFVLNPDGSETIGGLGGYHPVGVLLRAPRLRVTRELNGSWSVDPDPLLLHHSGANDHLSAP